MTITRRETMRKPCAVPGVDLLDAQRFAAGTEQEMFDALRRDDPVSWHPLGEEDGFWSLVRYEDVTAVNRDWETFTINDGIQIGVRGGVLGFPADTLTLATDPPTHTKMRLIVNRAFGPSALKRLEGDVRALVRRILDGVADRAPSGRLDFVDEIAGRLTSATIGTMLGIPPSDHERLQGWATKLFEELAVQGLPGEAGSEIFNYATDLALQRQQHPAEDMLTVILQAEVEGRSLNIVEFALFFLMLFVAGVHSTRSAAAQGLLSLLEDDQQRELLVRDPGLVKAAVEEMIRYSSPFSYFKRVATRPTVLGGRSIAEGDAVVMWFIAANRDPEVFPDPHRFDIRRDPNPHQAFGAGGPHYCLGAQLARLELRVLFEELLDRFPAMRLAGTPTRIASVQTPGIRYLPVQLGPDQSR